MELPSETPTTGWDERTFLDNYVSKLLGLMRNTRKSTFENYTRREFLEVNAGKRYIIAELGGESSKAMMGRSYIVGECDRYPRRLSKAQLKDESNRGVNNHVRVRCVVSELGESRDSGKVD